MSRVPEQFTTGHGVFFYRILSIRVAQKNGQPTGRFLGAFKEHFFTFFITERFHLAGFTS
jgi:hypothetical protein